MEAFFSNDGRLYQFKSVNQVSHYQPITTALPTATFVWRKCKREGDIWYMCNLVPNGLSNSAQFSGLVSMHNYLYIWSPSTKLRVSIPNGWDCHGMMQEKATYMKNILPTEEWPPPLVVKEIIVSIQVGRTSILAILARRKNINTSIQWRTKGRVSYRIL